MTKAKITNADGYKCAPLGYRLEYFAFGEIVEGQVAEWAVQDRAASRVIEKRPYKKRLETK